MCIATRELQNPPVSESRYTKDSTTGAARSAALIWSDASVPNSKTHRQTRSVLPPVGPTTRVTVCSYVRASTARAARAMMTSDASVSAANPASAATPPTAPHSANTCGRESTTLPTAVMVSEMTAAANRRLPVAVELSPDIEASSTVLSTASGSANPPEGLGSADPSIGAGRV